MPSLETADIKISSMALSVTQHHISATRPAAHSGRKCQNINNILRSARIWPKQSIWFFMVHLGLLLQKAVQQIRLSPLRKPRPHMQGLSKFLKAVQQIRLSPLRKPRPHMQGLSKFLKAVQQIRLSPLRKPRPHMQGLSKFLRNDCSSMKPLQH